MLRLEIELTVLRKNIGNPHDSSQDMLTRYISFWINLDAERTVNALISKETFSPNCFVSECLS